MKFSKYNNPKKRRAPKKRSPYSAAYIAERRAELDEMLARTEDPQKREMLITAFNVSINP